LGGDLGGDLGGEEGGEMDLGGEEGGEMDLGGEEGGEEDTALLAAPGHRDDGGYVTPGSKDKAYFPVKRDRRKRGARKRKNMADAGMSIASTSNQNLFKGLNDLNRLGNGLNENVEPNYTEELKVRASHSETKSLIESLQNLESKKNEAQ
jgi:hypothetical protein